MPYDIFFHDRAAKKLTFSSPNLASAIEQVFFAAVNNTPEFNACLNGHFLISDHLLTQARESKDQNLILFAEFVHAYLVLTTKQAPLTDFTADEFEKLRKTLDGQAVDSFLARAQKNETANKLGILYYPFLHALFSNSERSLDHFVVGHCANKYFELSRNTLFVTMGSCFAENIAKFLSAMGLNVKNFASPEEASPNTLPILVESIMHDPQYKEVLAAIRAADNLCIIFTAGVGEMVTLRSGEIVSMPQIHDNAAKLRSVSQVGIAETDSIKSAIALAFANLKSINPNTQIVCTVSPVPIGATLRRNSSVFVANSISKASLVIGINEFCKSEPNSAYFPSYEIVKDWAPLAGFQPFCRDDGHPRHVSENLVFLICLTFVKYFLGKCEFDRVKQQFGIGDLNILRSADID
jgi:hypothetical protein